MVLDLGVSNLPMWLFMIVHLTAFAVGGYFAYRAYAVGRSTFGAAFALYAVAEVLYMGYHVGVSTFLLSHTLAEVLNLVSFVLVFVAMGQSAIESRRVSSTARA